MFRILKLSDDFIQKFFKYSVNKLSNKQIDNFLNKVDSTLPKFYFTKSSENNLLRILETQFQINLFVSDLLRYDYYLEILLTIVSYSNYLTDILVQNPNYFYWITNEVIVNKKLDKKYYYSALKNIDSNFSSFSTKLNSIRNFKRREILRIGVLDYYIKKNISIITNLLSLLAISISDYLFSICLKEVKSKYKVKKLPKYCIIGVGKLGGCELNYSSDIDLMIFIESNLEYYDNLNSVKVYEEAVKLFINTSSQLTEKGGLYRIDFRLRPYGRNSELVNTISNYLYYYENQSEQWEKQMLIKCSFISGSKSLYRRFNEYIQNIIYPKTFFTSPIEKLKTIKISIEFFSKTEQNIKLSAGGIRDIEFAIQALQILNGSRYPKIKQSNSLKAIRKLYHFNLINKNEYENLISNYILFRKIEHFMQLMNNIQTHIIPEDGEILNKISFILGYTNPVAFINDVNRRKLFNANFFNQIVTPQSTFNKIDKINFANKHKAENNFKYLSTGIGLLNTKKFDESTINAFIKISESINENLNKAINPDVMLDNFTRLIKTHSLPIYWYDVLKDKKLLELTLNICEQSKYLFDMLIENQEVRESFLSRTAFNQLDENQIYNINSTNFKFRSALQLFVGIINYKRFSDLQTIFFYNSLVKIINENDLTKKYGNDLLIIGFGSFASMEMNLFSDIDIVFIVNKLDKYTEAQKDCQLLVNCFQNRLKVEIDCRLRPEGKNSPLVWNFSDYVKYIESRADVWELLTFTKSRMIYGDKSKFDFIVYKVIEKVNTIDDTIIKNELLIMRNKLVSHSDYLLNLKKIKGGLIDLNFVIGYYCLNLSKQKINLFELSFVDKIYSLIKLYPAVIKFRLIEKNYITLKKFEIFYQLYSGSRNVKLNIDDEYFKYLTIIFNSNSTDDLFKLTNNILIDNNKIFNETFT